MIRSKDVCEKCDLYKAYIKFGQSKTFQYKVRWNKKLGLYRKPIENRISGWLPFSECLQCDREWEHLIMSGKL